MTDAKFDEDHEQDLPYGRAYVVPEIARILAVDPACGEEIGSGEYSFSGKSFELKPLSQKDLVQMSYN